MPNPPASAVNENLESGIVRLAAQVPPGERRRFESVTAAATGLQTPIFNRVFVFDPPSRSALAEAVDWMLEWDVPFWVVATDATVEAVDGLADDLGLERAGTQPGMALTDLEDVRVPTTDLEIVEVDDEAGRAEFSEVSAATFGMPSAVAAEVDRVGLESEEIHSFLGRLDGEPVACGNLIRTGDVAGVYTIGVLEEYRRRGFGEVMTLAVVDAGRDHGCDVATLQSSEMAYSLYEQLGFETVVTYHLFEPVA